MSTIAIVRDAGRFEAPADSVVEVLDLGSAPELLRAVAGADAIVVTIGINRKTHSPWAPLVSPPDTCSRTVAALVEAMKHPNAPKRIIYTSAFGAAEQWKKLPLWTRALIASSKIRIGYSDHTAAEARLQASGLDWTILRPTSMSDEARQDWAEAGPETSVLRKIPRAAVAAALLDMLDRPAKHRTISITGA
jgi:kynurenine 3-monooxygenase